MSRDIITHLFNNYIAHTDAKTLFSAALVCSAFYQVATSHPVLKNMLLYLYFSCKSNSSKEPSNLELHKFSEFTIYCSVCDNFSVVMNCENGCDTSACRKCTEKTFRNCSECDLLKCKGCVDVEDFECEACKKIFCCEHGCATASDWREEKCGDCCSGLCPSCAGAKGLGTLVVCSSGCDNYFCSGCLKNGSCKECKR